MEKQIIVSINPFYIHHHVVEYAMRIARHLDLPLLLYSVQHHVTVPVVPETGGQVLGTPGTALLPPDWEQTVEEKTKRYYEEIKRAYPNTHFEHDLGMLAESVNIRLNELYQSAQERTPYMLVMAKTNDYSWWSDVIGTAETAIAAEAPCPVLFVPEDRKLATVNRILYLADRESLENAEYPGFGVLNTFSEKMGAKITVGFIAGEVANQPYFNVGAAMEMLRLSLPNQGDHEFRFFSDHSAEQILDLAKLTQMDIVAFPFRETGLFERFFENEVTRTLVLKSEVPVLVF